MFKASGKAKKGTLGVCPVRLRLKDKKDLDMYGWVTSGHVRLETINSTNYIIVWMLIDSGAQCSVFNKHLSKCIEFVARGEFKERISGSTASKVMSVQHGLVDLFSEEGKSYRIRTRFIPELVCSQSQNDVDIDMIKQETKMSDSVNQRMIWTNDGGVKMFGLLGAESMSLHGQCVDPETLGLRRTYISTDLRLLYLPWTAHETRRFIFVGDIGVDESRLHESEAALYPSFLVPPHWQTLSTIPADHMINIPSKKRKVNVMNVGVEEGCNEDYSNGIRTFQGDDSNCGEHQFDIRYNNRFNNVTIIKLLLSIYNIEKVRPALFITGKGTSVPRNGGYFSLTLSEVQIVYSTNSCRIIRLLENLIVTIKSQMYFSIILCQSKINEYYQDKTIFLNFFAIINSHYFSCEEFHNTPPNNVMKVKFSFHSFKISTKTFNYERLLQKTVIVIRDTELKTTQFNPEPQAVQTCMSKYEQSLTLGKIFIAFVFYVFLCIFTAKKESMGGLPFKASFSAGDSGWYKDEDNRNLVTSGNYITKDFLSLYVDRFYDQVNKRFKNATSERDFNEMLIFILCGIAVAFVIACVSALLSTYKSRKQKAAEDKKNKERFDQMRAVVSDLERGMQRKAALSTLNFAEIPTPVRGAGRQSIARLNSMTQIGYEGDDKSFINGVDNGCNNGAGGSRLNGPSSGDFPDNF